jgi:hypothetical protein
VRQATVFLFVIAVGTLLCACDTGYNFSTSPSDQHLPGAGTSSPLGSPTTSGAPPCTARELSATSASRQNPNDVGGAIGEVIISDLARNSCELRGVPNLHLFERTGSPIQVENSQSVSPVLPPVVVQPKGKSTAELVFTWQNWCGAALGTLEIQVDLGDGGGVVVAPMGAHARNYVPTCTRPDTPSVLRVEYAYEAAGASKSATA